jgi:hypothetical protein
MANFDHSKMKRISPGSAVRVGSIWVPDEQLPQVLAPYTKLVFCLTSSDDHPYSLRGSATGLRFQGQHLLFCCAHQIAETLPRNVVIPVDKTGRKLVSGTRIMGLNELPEIAGEEVVDVCAIYFDPADYGEPQLEGGFFVSKVLISGTSNPTPHSWSTAIPPACGNTELTTSTGRSAILR